MERSNAIRYRQHDSAAVLCAFDLIELDGEDLHQKPIEERKHALANVLFRERDGIAFNCQYDCDGTIIFKHACALGCEGIVSKRVGLPYRSGRVSDWLKIKNPLRQRWGGSKRKIGRDSAPLPTALDPRRPQRALTWLARPLGLTATRN